MAATNSSRAISFGDPLVRAAPSRWSPPSANSPRKQNRGFYPSSCAMVILYCDAWSRGVREVFQRGQEYHRPRISAPSCPPAARLPASCAVAAAYPSPVSFEENCCRQIPASSRMFSFRNSPHASARQACCFGQPWGPRRHANRIFVVLEFRASALMHAKCSAAILRPPKNGRSSLRPRPASASFSYDGNGLSARSSDRRQVSSPVEWFPCSRRRS